MNESYVIIGLSGGALFFVCTLFLIRKVLFGVSLWMQADDPIAVLVSYVPVSPLTRYVTRFKRVERLLEKANRPPGFLYDRILAYKEISVWATCMAGIFLYVGHRLANDILIVLVFGIVFSLSWPELFLARVAAHSRVEAKRQLPRVIDLMQVYILGGSNVEQAITKVGQHLAGEWGHVFKNASFRLSIGVPFAKAFTQQAFLLDPDFKRFFTALTLAKFMGVSLGHTLEVQAALLRSRRRQETEAAARQASVLISLPLVLCIFPALLIIYLAPAILTMLHSL